MSTGFVVVGTTASQTALVKYFEDLPSGTIDISDGIDFPQFFPTSLFDNAMFLPRPDDQAGFSKYVVDASGALVEEGVIPTIDPGSFRIAVKDSQTGVFQDRANSDIISVFNPETLEVTGTIDMTAAFVPMDIGQRYQRFYFRGDDVFAPVRGNVNGEAFTSFILHQGNLMSNSFVGDTQRDGNGFSQIISFNDFGQQVIDGAGNLYIPDAGAQDGTGLAARVNRINAGTNEIDPTYVFEPAVIVNPANVFLPAFVDFKMFSDTKAIARVNAETPQEVIDIIVAAGGVQNLTGEQIQQILGILFTAESARWSVLDVVDQSVTIIDGIPAVGAISGGGVFFHDGDVFVSVATQTENGYYRYDPDSGSASKAFEVTGADIAGVFNLANNN
jgi:hypothetical protein